MKDICCIGHITKDKIMTPRSTVYMAGGTSFYFSYALRQLPPKVSFCLVTAMEPTEAQPVEQMRQAGIEVALCPSRSTVFFENIYTDNSDDRQQRVLAKADPFRIEQLQHVRAKVFHLGSLLNDDFPIEVIDMLAQRGRLSVDVQGFLREVQNGHVCPIDWKDKRHVLQRTYYLKVNESEMTILTGQTDPHRAALLLADWGVKEVCVTLGHRGSMVYVDGRFYDIPAYVPRELVDATGCGDTYSAGYLYGRLQGMSPYHSGCFAAAMCTLKLEHNGPFHRTAADIEIVKKKEQVVR